MSRVCIRARAARAQSSPPACQGVCLAAHAAAAMRRHSNHRHPRKHRRTPTIPRWRAPNRVTPARAGPSGSRVQAPRVSPHRHAAAPGPAKPQAPEAPVAPAKPAPPNPQGKGQPQVSVKLKPSPQDPAKTGSTPVSPPPAAQTPPAGAVSRPKEEPEERFDPNKERQRVGPKPEPAAGESFPEDWVTQAARGELDIDEED